MNIDKLVELYNKQKKYNRIIACLAVPIVLVLVIAFWCTICNLQMYIDSVICAFSIGCALAIVMFIFGRKAEKYDKLCENHIISMVSDFINDYGIPSDGFQILFDETNNEYNVAFHNQQIDYDDLNKKVQEQLSYLNKVANHNVKVNLL